MLSLKSLVRAEKRHELILAVLLFVYALFDLPTPEGLAKLVDTTIGNIVVVVLALSLFGTGNPLLGVLGVVAADALIKRSSDRGSSDKEKQSAPSINLTNDDDNNTYGNYSGNVGFLAPTLEEDMVSKMAPLVTHEGAGIDYQPHMPYSDAASLNE
jgi:hypothetical protein